MSDHDFSEATWRKSTRSGGDTGQCVEIAGIPATIGIRDSKNPHGPNLAVARAAFGRLIHDLKSE
jgi:hypothetical protein